MNFPVIVDEQDFNQHFQNEIWLTIAETICARHRIAYRFLERRASCEHIVFLVDDCYVIKIYKPFRNGFRREQAALRFAQGKTNLPLPEILFAGAIENFDYLVTTQLAGVSLDRKSWLELDSRQQTKIVAELADGLKQLHAHDDDDDDDGGDQIHFDWNEFVERQTRSVFERQKSSGVNDKILARLPAYLPESLPLLPANSPNSFLHGDVHFGNLRFVETGGDWRISGLFDFADSLRGFYEYDFLAVGVLMIQGQGELQREFFRTYGYADDDINETLRRRLMLLTILYECSDLRRYALRLRPEAVDYSLDELERAIWNFI